MKRPLALAGITVLLTQWILQKLPSVVYLPLAVIFVLFSVVFCRKKSKNFKAACAFGAAAFSACWLFAFFQMEVKPLQSISREAVPIEAVVTEVQESSSPQLSRVYLQITSCGDRPVSYRAVCDYFPKSEIGDVVTAEAELSPLCQNREKQFCYPDRVYLWAACSHVTLQGFRPSPMALMHPVQQRLSRQLQQAAEGENGQILAAMITGDKSALNREIKWQFRQAGVSHVLVVSGLHISMVVFTLFSLLWHTTRRRRLSAAVSFAVLLCYMLFTGLSPSVLRAGLMAILLLSGAFFYQKSDGLTALGLAALVLVLLNPYYAMDYGVLLSFAATLGVLLAGKTEVIIKKQWQRGILKKLAVPVSILLVPLFAMLFTLPLQIALGGTVSLFSLFANLLIVPAVQPLLLLGLLAAACLQLPLLVPVSRFLIFLLNWLLFYIKKVVSVTAAVPFGRLALSGGFALLALGLAVLAFLLLYRKQKLLAAAVSLALLLLASGLSRAAMRDVVRVAEVGSGKNTAVVLLYEGKSAVLFRGNETNAYAVRQYLDTQGIRRADMLINMENRQQDAFFQQVLGRKADENLRDPAFYGKTKRWNHAIMLDMERQKTGALCRLWIDGIQILIPSGTTDVQGWGRAELLLPASGRVKGVEVQAIVCTNGLPAWLQKQPPAPVYADMGRAEIWVKPQRGFWIRDGG